MKKTLQKSLKYVFSIVPLAVIIIVVNIKKSAGDFNSISRLPPMSNQSFTANSLGNKFADLPCGFISRDRQEPEKATFVTNNYIPILQYPSGNFPGTTTQVYNSIYSENQNDQLVLQLDGNLVLYCISCNPKKAIWSANTKDKDGKALFFQGDGDLVLRNSLGKVVWHSNIRSTCTGSDQAYFTLQDDGNLAMLFNETTDHGVIAHYLGGTGSTNDQLKMTHSGKIQ